MTLDDNTMELMHPVSVVKVKDGIVVDDKFFISNADLKLLKNGINPYEDTTMTPDEFVLELKKDRYFNYVIWIGVIITLLLINWKLSGVIP